MKNLRLILIAACLAGTIQASTFTGVITDTMCGPKHQMVKSQPDAACIRMCVKGQSDYALFDGTSVLRLSDQKKSAKYAGRKVNVTGTLDEKTHTIKVVSIDPGE